MIIKFPGISWTNNLIVIGQYYKNLYYVDTAKTMPQYGFSLNLIFPYKYRICNSILIRNIRVSKNPYPGLFYSMEISLMSKSLLTKKLKKLTLFVWFI